MSRLRLLALVLGLAAPVMACDRTPNSPASQANSQARVQELLKGVWRLTSYIPEEQLSPSMLFSMQTDKILIRFEDGRIQSATASIQMDRPYRIGQVTGNQFKLFIRDEGGLETESNCWFDSNGSLNFMTLTAPWRGRGSLMREGSALDRPLE
ncbi:MAG TPA: hypothetical protein VFB62_13220 [Polyangiaceae bacterium]|jgi:hypothetical protein|nr:hypothetical protein [Polyangiaceae bacterium]